ncbi:MAG: hypothetical protein HGB11_12780 [Chlorobiales bacterium]|nr:hypothetical protein [Chlorobiales bacterium]
MNKNAIVIGLLSFFTATHSLVAQPVTEPFQDEATELQEFMALAAGGDEMPGDEVPPDEPKPVPPQFQQGPPDVRRPMKPLTDEERKARHQMMVDNMAKRLSLNDKQKEKVASIMNDAQEQAKKDREEAMRERQKRMERMTQKRKETDEKILSLLYDKQKQEFNKMTEERAERVKSKRPHRRPSFDEQPGCPK